jgi:hypothetical protein
MPDPNFDDYEIDALHRIAAHFHSGHSDLFEFERTERDREGEPDGQIDGERDESRFAKLQRRLLAYGFLYTETVARMRISCIHPELAELVHRIDNPPPVDYWENLTVWFKSRWWSLPVMFVFVVLPALLFYISMFYQLLNYLLSGQPPGI